MLTLIAGGICALANVLPGPVCQLVSLYNNQQHEEARQLQVPPARANIFMPRPIYFSPPAPADPAQHRGDQGVRRAGAQAVHGLGWLLRRARQAAAAAPHPPAGGEPARGLRAVPD